MFLWQQLIDRADRDKIDVDRDAAERFFRGLPFQTRQRFVWSEWHNRIQALRWVADQRRKHGRIRAAMPESVDVALTKVLRRTRVGIQTLRVLSGRPASGWNSRLSVKLTRRDGRLARAIPYDDQQTFWQAVFVEFFDPQQLAGFHGVCGECSNRLPRTVKLQRSSRARLCPSCRVRKHRQENRDHYRLYERERKRVERKSPATATGRGE